MNIKRKKFCLVIPTLAGGGMERIMSEFANYLANNNIDVWLILMFRHEMFYKLDSRIKIIQPSLKKRSNLTYALYLFPFLRIKIKNINPDVILSFGERYNSYVLLATLGLKIPIFISDRSSPYKRLSKLYFHMSKILYRKATGIIAQTTKAAENMFERLSGSYYNIKVIPNSLRQIEKNETTKKNQIVALGRLVREKRYDRLLDIMSRLKNQTWNLVIVGEGRMRPQIEQLIDDYHLGSRVILAGQQKNVDSYLSESKIYVLTSDIEGYPNALCEAMAHGLACISFDCVAGPGDIIDNERNGILVEDGNTEKFAKELDILIEDSNKRKILGEEAKKIQFKLTGDKIFEQYLQFIFSNRSPGIMH